MATHLIDGSSYPCPHCRNLLEVPNTRWRGWLLCPDCALPCLPPERLAPRPKAQRSIDHQSEVPQGLPEHAGALEVPAPKVTPAVPRAGLSTSSSAPRLIIPTGLFVSAFLLLVAYLDRSSHNMAIFGTLTFIFFILLLRIRLRG